MSNRKLIFIMGPTATGKTDIAVDLAYSIGEIVSVDSMQVYKFLNCGTAKPKKEQMQKVNHYLIDIVNPNYRFSAGDFKRLALNAIDEIHSRGKIPFLVGGTGLYFRTIERGLIDAPPADVRYREQLYEEEKKTKGILYEKLMKVDRDSALRIHKNDLIRIVRALEIHHLTGIPFSEWMKIDTNRDFSILKIGITLERPILYKRIEKRCYSMLECGLAKEVVQLLNSGYDERYPSMKGLGYSHFINYLKGCLSYNETVREFIRDTKRFAKRQFTWFRSDNDIEWYSPSDVEIIRSRIFNFIYDSYNSYRTKS